jgi:hypothetical protein
VCRVVRPVAFFLAPIRQRRQAIKVGDLVTVTTGFRHGALVTVAQ